MDEFWKLGAAEGAQLVRDGRLRPSAWMQSVLDRTAAHNPRLNAITVDLGEQALEAAAEADAAVDRGDELGSMHGVPVTIKENIDVAGQANPNGVPAYADVIATEDAPLVRRLREAGAIVFGMTNTPEFSMRATTDNPLRGRTINPWGDDISPGGSSGGAGVAAASGMGPVHHGNDIGGSLRFPSFMNGVTTVKPTIFRVPVYNASAAGERGPLAQATSVQGVIARHTADVRLALREITRPDPRDPHSPPVPFDGPAVPKRVGVTRATGGYDMHPEITALIDAAAGHLADAGYDVVEVETPDIMAGAKGWFSALTTEMRELFSDPLREHGSDTINQIFEWYFELSELLDLRGYLTAVGHRTALMRDWSRFMVDHPLVLTPFVMRPAFDWNDDAQSFEAVKDLFDSSIWSTGTNYVGMPTGVIGTGMAGGRPAAVQVVGPRWREDLICDALEAIEARIEPLPPQLWTRMG